MTGAEFDGTGDKLSETPINLGRDRLHFSRAFGEKFYNLLEQQQSLSSELTDAGKKQLAEALGNYKVSGGVITFAGQDSEIVAATLFRAEGLPEITLGTKIDKPMIGGLPSNTTSNGVLLEIQSQLGITLVPILQKKRSFFHF